MDSGLEYEKKYEATADMINCRFSLKIVNSEAATFNGKRPEKLLVLMRNPSTADDKNSDPTVNNLLKGLGNSYREVIVVNLTPVVGTNSDHWESDDIDKNQDIDGKEVMYFKAQNDKAINGILDQIKDSFDFMAVTGNIEKSDIKFGIYQTLMDRITSFNPRKIYAIDVTNPGFGTLVTSKLESMKTVKEIRWTSGRIQN